MAAISMTKSELAASFKSRLESLDCPYIEGVEESWITQLIFTPGEHRSRLLQWLFSRIDPKLSSIVEGYHSTQEREQRLLFAASILGLCKRKDFDVVRGTCSFPGQASFMDQLLDMVCIIDSSEDATQRAMSSPGHISESRPLVEQAEADSHLMDRLSRQYTFQTMFSHKLDLLPPDIKHSVEKGWTDAGHQKGSGPDPPDVNTLLEAAARLNRQLDISTAQLHHLKGKLMTSLDTLKTSYSSICHETNPQGDQVSDRHNGIFNNLASISQSAALRMQDCISVLDQSVCRTSALQDSTLLASTTLS
ncbi:HAUS augmin-like complex subunit 7 isoform X2 [Branchiostoma lanceolatum]|uniref:HAUS augmin-like complex subunit 7 isoform X2 n=1 Tax=Branchiostoma lanceolatum TaxID=7740 RepID=UPI0034557897